MHKLDKRPSEYLVLPVAEYVTEATVNINDNVAIIEHGDRLVHGEQQFAVAPLAGQQILLGAFALAFGAYVLGDVLQNYRGNQLTRGINQCGWRSSRHKFFRHPESPLPSAPVHGTVERIDVASYRCVLVPVK